MNAILSLSLALGRAIAAQEGKELWQVIREMARETMVKFIAANAKDPGGKDVGTLEKMSFESVKALFRQTAAQAIKEGKEIHALLRTQLPVYTVK